MIKHLIAVFLLTILVLIVSGVGLYLAGSPGENRSVRYDEIRLRDLDRLKNAIDSYYQDNYQLPTTISQLLSNRVKTDLPYIKKEPKDPQSKAGYVYRIIDETKYELCATFATASEDIAKRKSGFVPAFSDYSYTTDDRSHPKELHCYSHTPPDYLLNQQNNLRDYYNTPVPLPEEEATESAF